MADADVNEDLLDYEEEEATEQAEAKNGVEAKKEGAVKGNYVSIHSSGFRDFLLKPEILRSIADCGFEHPSEVQHECIPQVFFSETRPFLNTFSKNCIFTIKNP